MTSMQIREAGKPGSPTGSCFSRGWGGESKMKRDPIVSEFLSIIIPTTDIFLCLPSSKPGRDSFWRVSECVCVCAFVLVYNSIIIIMSGYSSW